MNTEMRTCDPTVPVIDAGLEGQEEALLGITQTTPEEEA
jgi:hypothetical protein